MSTTLFTNDEGNKALMFVQDDEKTSPSMVNKYKKKIAVRRSHLTLPFEWTFTLKPYPNPGPWCIGYVLLPLAG